MGIGTGTFKETSYKVEATYGVAPGTGSAQVLRRVESTMRLSKEAYQSAEKRTDQQVADLRHGVRRGGGSLVGELSPGAYEDFFAAIVRRDFTAISALTALSITIAAGATIGGLQSYTVTRSAGDFLAAGLKAGMVVRLTAGSFNAANLNKNLLIVSLTATVLTVLVCNGSTLTAEGPIASATVTLPGKVSWVPVSGHTDKSFAIEEWFPEVPTSELYLGCKPVQCQVDLPPTGLARVNWQFQGKDVQTSASRYYVAPTAAPTAGLTAAVNGLLLAGGVPVAIVTGLQFSINGNFSGEPVVGANTIPQVFPGRITVEGQLTAYFDSTTLRDAFIAETELSLVALLTADNTAAAEFVSFVTPRIKVKSADKDDPESGIKQTIAFDALFNSAGGTGVSSEKTTLLMHDSLA